MFSKILIFIIGTSLGIAITYYNRWLVRNLGMISWAERFFGSAGTYLMWQIAGVLVVVFVQIYVFNGLDGLGNLIVKLFGGG